MKQQNQSIGEKEEPRLTSYVGSMYYHPSKKGEPVKGEEEISELSDDEIKPGTRYGGTI